MRILVVVALPEGQEVLAVDLEEGASIAQALAAACLAERHPGLALDRVGVWGRRREPGHVLREGDRVEVYRPLRADAKAMRRERAGVKLSPRSRNGP
ncbi:MAG TPA: RnfH family protein [Usitatibacteraceae bacterium]|nr:RnfH family protein [Usitatibacteraceae bacterium]